MTLSHLMLISMTLAITLQPKVLTNVAYLIHSGTYNNPHLPLYSMVDSKFGDIIIYI